MSPKCSVGHPPPHTHKLISIARGTEPTADLISAITLTSQQPGIGQGRGRAHFVTQPHVYSRRTAQSCLASLWCVWAAETSNPVPFAL